MLEKILYSCLFAATRVCVCVCVRLFEVLSVKLKIHEARSEHGDIEIPALFHSLISLSSVPSDSVSVPSLFILLCPFFPFVQAVVEHTLSFLTKIDGLWCLITQNGILM